MPVQLNDIIKKVIWPDVAAALWRCYPDQEKSRQEKSREGYQRVFETLNALRPTPTNMRIWIRTVQEEDEPPYVHVSGKDGSLRDDGTEESYGIELVPWAEWLGMAVEPAVAAEYTNAEIVAHCLFEMTFYGFGEETIREFKADLKRQVEEIHRMTPEEREEYTLTLKQLEAELFD